MGFSEVLVIASVITIILGAKRLPRLGALLRQAGMGFRQGLAPEKRRIRQVEELRTDKTQSPPKQLLSVGLALLALGGGCTRHRLEKGVLYLGNGTEPKDLDPHLTTGVSESSILINLFEGLVSVDPKTLQPIPAIAERWTLSSDGKKYLFHLRKDAKWSNGEPLTASDFVYAWRRLLDPKTAAEYAYQAYYLVNGKAYNTGKIKDPSRIGVKALDRHTLEVHLVHPTPFFLSLLFHHSLYPVHRGTIEKNGLRWTHPEHMVSNGAFRLARWETNKIIALRPNPHYWDARRVRLKEVRFIPFDNMDTEEKMFRSGKLDITYQIPLEKIPYWKKDKSGAYHGHPYLGTYFYLINTTRKPLDDKRVRKAFALAVDRKRLIQYVTLADQLPGTIFVPPGTGGTYQSKIHLPADLSRLAEAKRLLKEAGYPDGKGMPPIEILYNTHEGHKKIGEALQQMWKENLGVEVTLYNQEWKVFLDSQRNLQFGFCRHSWIADYNDPNTFLELLVSDNGNNNTGWSNKAYDALMEKAARESNPKRRFAYFQEAEAILLDELPVIPLYIYNRNYLMNHRVKGWYDNIEDRHPLKYVTVE